MILEVIFLFLIFLCWGSFLNAVAYRILHQENFSIFNRSYCPKCNVTLYWYDLFPLFSYFILKGECRHCKKEISPLYPFIELLSAISFTLLFLFHREYFLSSFILFSALIISTRTDLETMLISRVFTLYLVPVGIIFSALGLAPITLFQSIIGTVLGFFVLYAFNKIFHLISKKDGIGIGDMDLLALIGSFLGAYAAWEVILISSIAGSVIGILLILFRVIKRDTRIPFGPFIALSTIFYVLFSK